MVSKKRGDLFPVFSQRITGTQQLVFLAILVIVVNSRASGKIVEANLQPRGADLYLKIFYPGLGRGG